MRLLFLVLFLTADATAQVGIGGQVGDPTGLSLKFGAGRGAIVLDAEWDFDDAYFVQGHYYLRERRLRATASDVRIFYGPGAFITSAGSDDPNAGISFDAGLGFYVTPEIEIFGRLTPRLRLTNDTDFDFGGGVGLRFYI